MEFIEWCNNNQGFIEVILSILTLIISISALYTSIKLAYIPYKKNIRINSAFGIKNNKYFLELIIANTGNKLIGINYIIVNYKNTYIGGNNKMKFIEPSKIKRYFFDLNLYENDTKFDSDSQIEINIFDTEKKEYKFKERLYLG